MQIFQSEIDDGLSDIIKSSASLSYACLAEPCVYSTATASSIKEIKSLASLSDEDLYYVQSILVTSSWNKNDDIFDKQEVWQARNTPEDKPTNLEHDENIIIGHITANWPITDDGVLIDENTISDNLPEKFHILTGSVIYRAFSNPELKERSDNLINEIENGQKYVSMECLFRGFDYGLLNKATNEYKVLGRDNNTAYLTKYLRSYGGMGEHENYKIGRVLRNITFSGKGFVNKPANPDSIIFTKDSIVKNSENKSIKKNTILSIAGVSDNQSHITVENNIMNLDNEVAELKTKIETLMTEAADANANVVSAQSKITQLEGILTSTKAELEGIVISTKAELEAVLAEKEVAAKKQKEEEAMKEEEMSKVKSELYAANEVIAAYKDKEMEMMKKEKKMKRMASLIEMGVDNESAEATVDKFDSLNDEAFEAMTSLFAGKMPPWLEKIKKKKDEEKDTKANVSDEITAANTDPELLETVEVEANVNLAIGGEAEDSVETTRAALVDFVSSRLGKKL
jgi:hypothetical protein